MICFLSIEKNSASSNLGNWQVILFESPPQDRCPYKWAKHPHSFIQENVCLIFSALFVLWRVSSWHMPQIIHILKLVGVITSTPQ